MTYTVTLDNLGTSAAVNIDVTNILPSGVTLQNADASVGSWLSSVWHIDSLAGAGRATLILTVVVNASSQGTSITSTASASSSDN